MCVKIFAFPIILFMMRGGALADLYCILWLLYGLESISTLYFFSICTFTCYSVSNGMACGNYKSMGNGTGVCYGIYLYHVLIGSTNRLLSFHPLVWREFGDCQASAM